MNEADYQKVLAEIIRQLKNAKNATNAAKQTTSRLMDTGPSIPAHNDVFSSIGQAQRALEEAIKTASQVHFPG